MQQKCFGEGINSTISRSTPNGHRSADDGCPARQQGNNQERKKAAGHAETFENRRARVSRGTYDVCEVFSPARLTARCGRLGLKGGLALDVSHACTVTGRKWDCLKAEDREWCRRMVHQDKPQLLVVSPRALYLVSCRTGVRTDSPQAGALRNGRRQSS